MKHRNNFLVRRFQNRNGAFSYRVEGRLCGVRIGRNFKTQEEAAAEKVALELQALQSASNLRSIVTSLKEVQVREAEDAFRRLEGKPRSLLFYLEYAFVHFRELLTQKPLAAAIREYVSVKQREYERSLLSPQQLRGIKDELRILQSHFHDAPLDQLSPSNLLPYLERRDPSLKTYNNRRSLVLTFFKFAVRQEWLAANPVEKRLIIGSLIGVALQRPSRRQQQRN